MCTNLSLYLCNSFIQQPITGILCKYKCIDIFVVSHFFVKQYHRLINTNTLLKYVHCLWVEHHSHGHVSLQQQHKIWIPSDPSNASQKRSEYQLLLSLYHIIAFIHLICMYCALSDFFITLSKSKTHQLCSQGILE